MSILLSPTYHISQDQRKIKMLSKSHNYRMSQKGHRGGYGHLQ